jgi:DNA-binding NarL/FixJ family response regulator
MTKSRTTIRNDLRKVLIADDNPGDRAYFQRLLKDIEEANWAISTCESAEEAAELYDEETFDLLLLDYYFPRSNGVKLFRDLQEDHLDTPPSVLSSSYGNTHLASKWYQIGGDVYVSKDNLDEERFRTIVSELVLDEQPNTARSHLMTTGQYNSNFLLELLESLLDSDSNNQASEWFLFFLLSDGLQAQLQKSIEEEQGTLLQEFVDALAYEEYSDWITGHYRDDIFWSLMSDEDPNGDIQETISTQETLLEEFFKDNDYENLGENFSLIGFVIDETTDDVPGLLDEINHTLDRASMTPGNSVLLHS